MFERLDIQVDIFKGKEEDPDYLIKAGALAVEKGEIYTFEGPNQAGKSVTVGALMGVYPVSTERRSAILKINLLVQINRRQFTPRNVEDALAQGIVAVFQDDEMIPTMTIREQLVLRHAARGIKGIWVAVRNMFIRGSTSKARKYLMFLAATW